MKNVETVKNDTPVKTLTVKHDKEANVYRAYDENGNEYTEEDCPRQIMMHLAYQKKQVLYFAGKNWRRKKIVSEATVLNVPVTSEAVKQ